MIGFSEATECRETNNPGDSTGLNFYRTWQRQAWLGLKYIATKQTRTKSREGDIPICSKIQCLILVTLPSLVMDSQQNVCGCIANSKIMQTAATWIWYVYIYLVQNTNLERHDLSFCMSQKDNRMSPFIALQLRSTLMPSSPLKLDVKMTAYSKNGFNGFIGFIQPFVAMLKGPISVTGILLLRGYPKVRNPQNPWSKTI